ncbi:amidohydrolase family protein, partial [Pseudomonas aeruginosa]
LRAWRDNGKARHGDMLNVSGMHTAYWSQVKDFRARFDHGEWADQPLAFIGSDHHTGWANAAMLKRAGIDAARVRALPEEQRNTIGHDADATPNGFLADAGLDAVLAVLPAPSAEQMLEAGRSAVRYSNSLGLTAWMDPAANGSPGDALFSLRPDENTVGVLPVYQRLAKGGELSAHVAALLVANPRSRPADLEVLDKVRQRFLGSPNLTLPGIKVFADGVPEYPAQTAALLEPYRNSRKTGELLIDPAHFGELVSAADARGWLVHVHAIGDRAVREAL